MGVGAFGGMGGLMGGAVIATGSSRVGMRPGRGYGGESDKDPKKPKKPMSNPGCASWGCFGLIVLGFFVFTSIVIQSWAPMIFLGLVVCVALIAKAMNGISNIT